MQDFFISIFVTILSEFTEYKIVLLDTCPCSSFLAFWISMSSCNCFSLINSASFFSSSARIFSVSSSTGGVFSFTCKTRQVRTRGSTHQLPLTVLLTKLGLTWILVLEAFRLIGTGAVGAGFGAVTGQAWSIFWILKSSWEIDIKLSTKEPRLGNAYFAF